MFSQQGVGERGNKSLCHICRTSVLGVNYCGGHLQMAEPPVRRERKQDQIENVFYTASIFGHLGGLLTWSQQSPHISPGKIREDRGVVLKHRPAHISLHPSIPSSVLLDRLPPLTHIWNYKSLSYGWLLTHVMTKFKCERVHTASKAIESLSGAGGHSNHCSFTK